jgi:hypothetical protein
VQVADPLLARIIRAGLGDAASQLADAGCQLIFNDFSDARGRPLAERLTALGYDADNYPALVLFRDAPHPKHCESGALAVTSPGSRVIFLCGPAVLRAWEVNRRYVTAALIHELLHTLGLPEDPPSSAEITGQVMLRCKVPLVQ